MKSGLLTGGSRLSNWTLAFLLVTGAFLWQRTAFPLWMVDIFPQQLGAYFWKYGEEGWMYTPVHRNSESVEHRNPIAAQLGAEGDTNAFFYPPFVAALLSPLCEYPAAVWRDVLFGINVVLIFVIAFQILLLRAVKRTWRSYLWSLALVLLCYPLARATKLGQIVPSLSVMMWSGLLAMRREKTWLAGIILGIVSAIKIFPLALVLLPILGTRRKLASIWLGTVAAIYVTSLLTLGIPVHRYWWEVMHEFSGRVQPFFGNQAPLGWFVRIFYHRGWIEAVPFTTPLLDVLRVSGMAIFLGVTIVALWKMRDRLFDENLGLSAGLLLSCVHLALPVMWEHYWVFVLPSLGWALWKSGVWPSPTVGGRFIEPRERERVPQGARDNKFWDWWLGVAAFFFLMKLTRFYGDTLFGEFMSGSQMWGMFLLWIWFVRRVMLSANQVQFAGKVAVHESLS